MHQFTAIPYFSNYSFKQGGVYQAILTVHHPIMSETALSILFFPIISRFTFEHKQSAGFYHGYAESNWKTFQDPALKAELQIFTGCSIG